MASKLIEIFGNLKLKVDIPDTDSRDKKRPHVYLQGPGGSYDVEHIYLDEVDNLVGTGDSNRKKAIYYIRDHKEKLEKIYNGEE